jgi:hypothetical protein
MIALVAILLGIPLVTLGSGSRPGADERDSWAESPEIIPDPWSQTADKKNGNHMAGWLDFVDLRLG